MINFEKPSIFSDCIKISDTEKIEFSFTPEEIGERYYEIIKQLTKEEKNKNTENADKYSRLFIELCCLLFGEENTKTLLDCYSSDYKLLIDQVVFYTGTKIAPVMREASKRRAKRIKQEKKAIRAASFKRWFS